MNLSNLKNIIYSNKSKVDEIIRDAGVIPVAQPVKMFVTDFVLDNGFANVKVAAELGVDQYIEKDFSFKAEGKGRIFLEKFLNNAFPDRSTELTTGNIIGRAFIGKVVINDGHENLEAVGDSDDIISADVSDTFVETDEEELPFV